MKDLHLIQKSNICATNEKGFLPTDELKRHLEDVHKEKVSFIFIVCKDRYESNKDLEKHSTLTRKYIVQKIVCFVCDLTLGAKSSLKKHIANVHEGKMPFKCRKHDTRDIYIFVIHQLSSITN